MQGLGQQSGPASERDGFGFDVGVQGRGFRILGFDRCFIMGLPWRVHGYVSIELTGCSYERGPLHGKVLPTNHVSNAAANSIAIIRALNVVSSISSCCYMKPLGKSLAPGIPLAYSNRINSVGLAACVCWLIKELTHLE